MVRVVNFTTYIRAKEYLDNIFKGLTGTSPLEELQKPGSSPTLTSVLTFTGAGLAAGLVASPIACEFYIVLPSEHD